MKQTNIKELLKKPYETFSNIFSVFQFYNALQKKLVEFYWYTNVNTAIYLIALIIYYQLLEYTESQLSTKCNVIIVFPYFWKKFLMLMDN